MNQNLSNSFSISRQKLNGFAGYRDGADLSGIGKHSQAQNRVVGDGERPAQTLPKAYFCAVRIWLSYSSGREKQLNSVCNVK